jgi:hypothetical protein
MSLPITPIPNPTNVLVIYDMKETSSEEVIVIDQPEGVTVKDIIQAENFGVMAGLQRHLHKSAEEKAKAALEIMEAIYASGFSEKVSLFVRVNGWELYQNLESPSMKAEFAIRTAKMMHDERQSEWCSLATKLLSKEDVCKSCSKKAIETLAFIFAKNNNLEQTLHWLRAANTEKENFMKAASEFFVKGAFPEGLAIIKETPGEISYNTQDFTELISYGLTNPHILKDPLYRESILSFTKDWNNQTIVLKALCYFDQTNNAIDLAEQIVLDKDAFSIYALLILSKYIQTPLEREAYLKRLTSSALELDARERKTTGWGPLYEAITSKYLTVQESLRICEVTPKPSIRANALWERACGVSNKWRIGLLQKTKKKDRNLEDVDNLQLILKAMRVHLMENPFSKDQGHPTFWVKIIRDQIEYDYWEDIEQTGKMWEDWRATRGLDWKDRRCNSDDIWFLSYWGLFQIVTGKVREGINSLAESYQVQLEEQKHYGDHIANNFYHLLIDAARHFLWNIESCHFDSQGHILLKKLTKCDFNDIKEVRLLLE